MTNAELIASARVCGSHNGCGGCKTEDRGPDCAFNLMLALADALEMSEQCRVVFESRSCDGCDNYLGVEAGACTAYHSADDCGCGRWEAKRDV